MSSGRGFRFVAYDETQKIPYDTTEFADFRFKGAIRARARLRRNRISSAPTNTCSEKWRRAKTLSGADEWNANTFGDGGWSGTRFFEETCEAFEWPGDAACRSKN